jgi:diguanylate cyclase (GGDEF)-like protein
MAKFINPGINAIVVKITLLLLILTPTVSEYMEDGHFPEKSTKVITDITMTILIGIGVFILYRKNKLLENLSLVDHLTGINNRRMFEIDIKREVLRSKRTNKSLCILFFDLDEFKKINDKGGHEEGDKVLIRFAQLLSDFSREGTDNCYRFGGDEFVVLLTEINKGEMEKFSIKIEYRIKNEIYNKLPNGVSASRGIVFLKAGESYQELLKRADEVMYQTKKSKRIID